MNDTPQGDGNTFIIPSFYLSYYKIRMNDTPQGDGNAKYNIFPFLYLIFMIRMNDTPQGDGNYGI